MNEEKLDGKSLDISEEKRQLLKQLFPEVFTEGEKIDFERLKLTLGEMVDVGKERFGLTWAGKADCFKTIQTPSTGTLLPCKEESVDFDTTENLYIEGDNLEVLKLLQKSYLGKVKMIYIDPPYNTGNDFIYPDNYSESLETYLEYTGQTDENGRRFSTNQETDGRFHSKWLNMMYPRLFLARNLLKEDGVIFISIDDAEQSNLKKICDEIFGEENFQGCVVRATGQTTGQDSGGLGSSFDYILVYTKIAQTSLSGIPLTDHDLKRFNNEDTKGKYAYDQMRKTGSNDLREDRPNMFYAIKDPDGKDLYPIAPAGYESCWRFEKKTYEKLVNENMILWRKTKRGDREIWWPYVKYYLEGRTKRPSPLWDDLEGNKKAARDLRALFDNKKLFDFPKPIGMLKRLIHIVPNSSQDDIILDFFSGSATTAHAVLDLNKQDGGNRKFILVQLPEPCDENSEAFKAGFKTIAEIGKERIRRVINRIKEEKAQLSIDSLINDEKPLDLGFKVMKLASSSFKKWNKTTETTDEELIKTLDEMLDNIIDGRTQEDILYEILLKSGFELSTPVETLTLAGKTVYSVAERMMLICLEDTLTIDVIRAMAELQPNRVVCLDTAFENNDQLKTNAVKIMEAKKVERFITV